LPVNSRRRMAAAPIVRPSAAVMLDRLSKAQVCGVVLNGDGIEMSSVES
jgi:hypothetical protein